MKLDLDRRCLVKVYDPHKGIHYRWLREYQLEQLRVNFTIVGIRGITE